MKKYVLFFSLMTMGLCGSLSAQQPTEFEIATGNWQGEKIEYVAGQVLVGLAQGAEAMRADQVFTDLNLRVLEPFDKLNIALLEVPQNAHAIEVATTLSQNPLFRYAEPNGIDRIWQVHPNDPYYEGSSPATYAHQYALHNTGQDPPDGTPDADIDAPEAWEYETGSSSILIGVLDSGLPLQNGSLSHPDLDDANRYLLGQDFVGDGNGVTDSLGHGTHVTGILAAETNNDTGIAGVNWQCKILMEQVFDKNGSGSHLAYKNAVIHAVDNGAKVINYSGGGSSSSTKEEAAAYADSAGVVQVYAAGNSGSSGVIYPARYAYTGTFSGHTNGYTSVISVAATQHEDARASYSSYSPGYNYVSVAAPGGHGGTADADDIFSTLPGYPVTLNNNGDEYGYLAGTSMAAPHVTGLAGLILARFTSYTASDVRTLIEQSAEDVNASTYPGFDERLGHGRINAHYALAPPTAPQNLVITNAGQNGQNPSLQWDANTEPDLDHYTIYRGTTISKQVRLFGIP